MPYHEEIVEFSKELLKLLPDHEIVSEHVPSRVVMFAKKEYKKDGVWHTWIDFKKFNELFENNEAPISLNYCVKTPKVGLSGIITKKDKPLKTESDVNVTINETTQEMEFWEGSAVSR